MSKGQYECSVWTDERNEWLIDNTKGLPPKEAYAKLKETFPEWEVSFYAMSNQRSRLKCTQFSRDSHSTKERPLYSEQKKKGYLRIKVAQPNVWWPKQKWVYVETHPWCINEIRETDCFYFLDGDNTNFNPDNIELVHRCEQPLFHYYGGCVPGKPEETRIHILQARLRLKQFDVMETYGGISHTKSGRVDIKKRNERARLIHGYRYKNDPEYREHYNQRAKEYRNSWSPEKRKKVAEVKRRWYERNKRKLKNENESL